MKNWLGAALGGLVLLAAPAARAQSPGLAGEDRVGAAPFGSQKPTLPEDTQVPRSSLAPLNPVVQSWPRIEAGAVLCRTSQDLALHAAPADAATGARPDCHLVPRALGVSILQHPSPGATEVRITGTGETGWTDSWLPHGP